MRLKLDENLGRSCADLLQAAGHAVATVFGRGMTSSADDDLFRACAAEGRALVTLGLDFSDPLAFPPGQFARIAVSRLGPRATRENLTAAARTFVEALRREELAGKLWSVEAGRIRVYPPPDGAG